MTNCKVCKTALVSPRGPVKSKLILIGDKPGQGEEVAWQLPTHSWDKNRAGLILEEEMSRAGVAVGSYRLTNLWLHTPPAKKSDLYLQCYDEGVAAMMKELVGRKAVLLMGTQVVNYFTGFGSSQVSSLIVDAPDITAPLVMAMVNPASALRETLGEVRLAIEHFAQESKPWR